MIELRQAPIGRSIPPLTWKGGRALDHRTALVACSRGHIASLSDHEIAPDGTVAPSLVCPEDGCDFHEFIRLVGVGAMSCEEIASVAIYVMLTVGLIGTAWGLKEMFAPKCEDCGPRLDKDRRCKKCRRKW